MELVFADVTAVVSFGGPFDCTVVSGGSVRVQPLALASRATMAASSPCLQCRVLRLSPSALSSVGVDEGGSDAPYVCPLGCFKFLQL